MIEESNSRKNELQQNLPSLLAIGIGIASLFAFLPVILNDFILYDDPGYVTQNTRVLTGISLSNLVWAFSSLHGETSYWHPLTWISHQLDCHLFGLSPGAHHLTNVIFHALSGMLLFRFLHRSTLQVWPSFFVALLFCFHPLHVESVAWVSERKDVLSGFFWMAALNVYLGYAQKPSARSYFAVLLLFALGLMSKPSLVVLPCALLLLDFWPLNRIPFQQLGAGEALRRFSRLLAEKIPFLCLSLLASVAAVAAQKEVGALAPLEAVSMPHRIDNAIVSYVLYLGKTFWPANLSVIYIRNGAWPFISVLASAAFLGVITFLAYKRWRSEPYLLVGWLWFIGVLIPMIGLVQVGSQSMADRYTYISLIGIFIMAAFGMAQIVNKWRLSWRFVVPASVAVVILLIGLTSRQLSHWKNSVTLFAHASRAVPNNWVAHFNYGMALAEEAKFKEADDQFTIALNLSRQDNSAVLLSQANLQLDAGNPSAALAFYKKVISIAPRELAAHTHLAEIYSSAHDPTLRDGRLAVKHAEYVCSKRRALDYKDIDLLAAGNGVHIISLQSGV